MGQALMLVDIQNDYFPGGPMELVGSHAAALQAKNLLCAFRQKDLRIVHIQHVSTNPEETFFLPDTEGVRIHESVAPRAGEAVIHKHFPNSFLGTSLLDYLQDHAVTELVIAGMMTHMCVDSTTRAAADFGFACTLALDACATRALSFGDAVISADLVQQAFLAALDGTFARVLSTEEIRADL